MADKGARWQLYRTPFLRRWRFRLIAANGEPLLTSEPYTTEAAARAGIASIVRNVDAPVVA